ncbi:hypothetical protein NQ314_018225 [Rhamnusium bicolor]|uniref:Cytochrome b561 domain-containing protein n=1 Tax=Rhamnusium bicolor TaxID=1586634 RepID=A0AAV8WTL2_9CUCU|nr:hypothetical protein NQ314_018225 [Rhamnusium bicolor]
MKRLISMIFLIISLGLGIAVNYLDAMKTVFPMRPVWYKLIHNLVGLLGYAIGIISLCYAYYTNWFIYYTGGRFKISRTYYNHSSFSMDN